MERHTLAILEEAELDARTRRLAAAAEAERILSDAAARVAEVEAGVGASVAAALAAARASSDDRLARGLRELAEASRALDDLAAAEADDPAVQRAAALVVAAVLAEGQT